MPVRIFLIRHGETEWSRVGKCTGWTDIALSPYGKQQSRELGECLRHIPFAHVFTSPLLRARQTCALAALAPSPSIDPDLTEWGNGDDEGRLYTEIQLSRPGADLFRDGSPHGERPAEILARADRFILRLRSMVGNVAVYSHGRFCRVLAARWIGLTVADAQHFLLETASFGVLSYEHGNTGAPAIAMWNALSHEGTGTQSILHLGDTRPVNQQALERWENEGGEIPGVYPPHLAHPAGFRKVETSRF